MKLNLHFIKTKHKSIFNNKPDILLTQVYVIHRSHRNNGNQLIKELHNSEHIINYINSKKDYYCKRDVLKLNKIIKFLESDISSINQLGIIMLENIHNTLKLAIYEKL